VRHGRTMASTGVSDVSTAPTVSARGVDLLPAVAPKIGE
jgi:hypothetical protein